MKLLQIPSIFRYSHNKQNHIHQHKLTVFSVYEQKENPKNIAESV